MSLTANSVGGTTRSLGFAVTPERRAGARKMPALQCYSMIDLMKPVYGWPVSNVVILGELVLPFS